MELSEKDIHHSQPLTRRTLLTAAAGIGGAGALQALSPATAQAAPGSSPAAPVGDAARAWRAYRHDNRRTGAVLETTLTPRNVGRLALAGTYGGFRTFGGPVAGLEALFVTGPRGNMRARRLPGMGKAWAQKAPAGPQDEPATPALGESMVIMSGERVDALDRSTGALLWSAPKPAFERIKAAPVLSGELVHVVGTGGTVQALSAATGAPIWTTPSETWHEGRLGDVWAAPAVSQGGLFVAADRLARLDAATGAVRWVTPLPTGGSTLEAVAVLGGLAFVPMSDAGLAAFDTETGAQRWQAPLGSVEPVAVADGRVYALSTSGLQCLDAATGAIRWSADVGKGTSLGTGVTLAGGMLFLGAYGSSSSIDQRIIALDAADGTELWRSPSTLIEGEIVVSNGSVFSMNHRGISRYRLA